MENTRPVLSPFLGKGIIVDTIKHRNKIVMVMVKFEKDPPKEYNGGINPCVQFPENLIRL